MRFPKKPTPEWYAVDLIQHRDMVGLGKDTLARRLRAVVARGELDPKRLRETAREFGTKETQRLIEEATVLGRGTRR